MKEFRYAGLNLRTGSPKSYLLSFLYCAITAVITVVIGFSTGYLKFNANHTIGITSAVLTLVIWIISSLGEEIGWRGYLHNHLKGFLHAPLAIGVVWGTWHFRGLLAENQTVFELIRFTILTILVSYFLSWLIEYGGSVLTCATFHGIWNFFRMKILFGNPGQGTSGYFLSSNPSLTEMEGAFGLLPVIFLSIPILMLWYRTRLKQAVY